MKDRVLQISESKAANGEVWTSEDAAMLRRCIETLVTMAREHALLHAWPEGKLTTWNS